MKTIHLIYPSGSRISYPDVLGRKLGQRLGKSCQVHHYNVGDLITIRPGPDDVLLGHANSFPHTVFRSSLRQAGWRRVILMTPYSHGDPRNNAFLDSLIKHCDLYLAITGNYWFNTIPSSIFAHWFPKMIHLDLAVDRADFPVIKTQFNPPGSRSFVYIGNETAQKNLGYLNQIASQLTGVRFSWIGSGRPFSHLKNFGALDFATAQARACVQEHDFMITVGKSDANPTTILEAMSWGLIPVCTEQSGYINFPGIVNVPLNNAVGAMNILQNLQAVPNEHLKEMQAVNWKALDEHFNWERFTDQVMDAIESNESPQLEPESIHRLLYLRWMAFLSPFAVWRRPRYLSRILINVTRRRFSL
jgi:glycosyltransferase involved in cell wall biosynthesis